MKENKQPLKGKMFNYLDNDPLTEKTGKTGKYITIFTDASYCHHTKATGWAIWIKFGPNGSTYRESGGYQSQEGHHSTKAELRALTIALEVIDHIPELEVKGKIVTIRSDCKEALHKLSVSELVNKGAHNVTKKWIKSHNGRKDKMSAINTWCDEAAKLRMREVRSKIKSSKLDDL